MALDIGELRATLTMRDELSATVNSAVANAKTAMDGIGQAADGARVNVFQLRSALLSAFGDPQRGLESLVSSIGADLTGAISAAGLGVAAGAAAIAGGLVAVADHAMHAGAALQDFSYKTAISVEQASKLEFAAKVTGSSLETLGTQIYIMQQRMTQTQATHDNFAIGLGRIGLAFKDINSLSPDQQFLKIASAFRENTTAVDRAQTAFELFGRQGREMVTTLMKPMEDLTKQAGELGHVMSAEDAKNAEELSMAWNHLKESMSWTGTEVGLGVIHFFEKLHGLPKEALEELRIASPLKPGDIGTSSPEDLRDIHIPNLGDGGRGLGDLPPMPDAVDLLKLNQEIANSIELHKKQAEEAKKAAEELRKLTDEIDKQVEAHRKDDEAMHKAIDSSMAGMSVLKDMAIAHGDLTISVNDGIDGLEHWITKLDATHHGMAELTNITTQSRDALAPWAQSLSDMYNGLIPASSEISKFNKHLLDLKEIGPGVHTGLTQALKVPDELKEWSKDLSELSRAFSELSIVAGGSFGEIAKDIAQEIAALNVVTKGMKTFEDATTSAGKAAGLVSAGTGVLAASSGGGAKGIGGGALAGAEMGAAFGPWGAAIGAAAGALAGIVQSLGGVTQAEKDARTEIDNWEKSLGSTLSATQKAEAGGVKWKEAVIAVRDQFAQVGLSAADAEAAVKKVWDAKSPEAYLAAVGEINKITEQIAATKTGVDAVTAAFSTAGTTIPTSMIDTINALLKMNGLTDAERAKLQGVVDAATPDFAKLTSLAGTYGISLADLGPKFQQADLEGKAKKVFDDFTALTQGGADFGKTALGMAKSISDVVGESFQFGTSVPENMRPMIQKLIDADKLVLANGSHIHNINDIKFEATPLDKGLANLQTTLDLLNTTLSVDLPKALHDLAGIQLPPKHMAVVLDVDPNLTYYDANKNDPAYMAAGLAARAAHTAWEEGGKVGDEPRVPWGFSQGGFVPGSGTSDSVHALLTPGELVMTHAQQNEWLGSREIVIHTHVMLNEREIAKSVERVQDRQFQTHRKLPAA